MFLFCIEIPEDVLKTLKKGEKVVSSRSKTENPIITSHKFGSQKSYDRKSHKIGRKSSQNLALIVVDGYICLTISNLKFFLLMGMGGGSTFFLLSLRLVKV